jgi:hypothetical protein
MRRAKAAQNWPTPNGLLGPILLVAFYLGGFSECQAAPDEIRDSAKVDLPTDLNLVPRDAAAFVHVRAADLWRSAWAKDFRYLVNKAGPEAWKTFEKKCPLDPSSLDQITLILLTPQAVTEPFPTVDPESMSALVVVTTSKPYDRIPLIQALGPREKIYRQNLYYFNEDLWSGLVLVDERTFLIGSEEALIRFYQMSRQQNRTGPLQVALMEAAGKHQVVVGLNATPLGKEKGAQFMPPPLQKLLVAHGGLLTLDLEPAMRLDLRLDFLSQDQAREGEKALRDTLDLARQGLSQPICELETVLNNREKDSVANLPENFGALIALGFLRDLDTLLKEAPVQRQELTVKLPIRYRKMDLMESGGPILVFSAAFAGMGISANATFNAIGRKVGGPVKDPVEEHLRNLYQALDKYQEKHGSYPPPALYDGEGRAVLSWRVALLPYLGEEALYREFRQDEPWDSLHNKRLLKKLPGALQSPNQGRWGSGRWKTPTQVFTGGSTYFEGKKGIRKTDITKEAILLAHVASDAAVYWTKPADLAYVADKPLPNLFGKYGGKFQVLLADGTYRTIDKTADEKTLRDLIERKVEKTGPAPAPQLSHLEALWNDFSQNDDAGTKKAWQAILTMIQSPRLAVPFLKDRLKPVPRPDMKRIDQWLAELDSGDFRMREQATKNLHEVGELAFPALEKKLGEKVLSLEARRRMEALLEKTKTVTSGEELRSIRAVEVLEGIGTPDAKEILEIVARGGEGAVVTEQAKKAVARLGKGSRNKK